LNVAKNGEKALPTRCCQGSQRNRGRNSAETKKRGKIDEDRWENERYKLMASRVEDAKGTKSARSTLCEEAKYQRQESEEIGDQGGGQKLGLQEDR